MLFEVNLSLCFRGCWFESQFWETCHPFNRKTQPTPPTPPGVVNNLLASLVTKTLQTLLRMCFLLLASFWLNSAVVTSEHYHWKKWVLSCGGLNLGVSDTNSIGSSAAKNYWYILWYVFEYMYVTFSMYNTMHIYIYKYIYLSLLVSCICLKRLNLLHPCRFVKSFPAKGLNLTCASWINIKEGESGSIFMVACVVTHMVSSPPEWRCFSTE